MASKKISELVVETVLDGTELVPIVKGGVNKAVAGNNLAAGKLVGNAATSMSSLTGQVQRLYPILVMPATGPMALTGSTANRLLAGQVTIPAGTIKGGEMLRMSASLSKLSAGTTGWAWSAKIGNVVLWQNSINASARFVDIQGRMSISSDRRWGYSRSINTMGQGTITGGDLLYSGSANNTPTVGQSARQRSTTVAFASYSTSPTIETMLVDFSQDQTIVVAIGGAADVVEMTDFVLEIIPAVKHVYNVKRINVYGDSIVEGTGATSVDTAWVNKTRLLRPGTPVVSYGLGGQISSQIIDRFVNDPSNKECRVVLSIGTNDFVSNGSSWFAAITAQIDRAVTYMGHTNWFWSSPSMRQGWVANDANDTALQYVLAQMISKYGTSHILDNRTIIDNTTDLADSVHPNDTGHNKMAIAADAKMTAIGWLL